MAKAVVREEKTTTDESVKKTADADYITLNFKGLTLPWAILLSVTILTLGISSALYFGLKARPVQTVTTTTTPTPSAVETFEATSFAQVSIPVTAGPRIGDASAKVVIYEFSDFVCPYCKKFHDEAYQTVFQNYVKTNKASIIYKYYPLAFHEPAATLTSKAAYCIQTAYGDAKFLEFATAFYANVNGNTQNAYDSSNNPVINLKDTPFNALLKKIGVDTTKIRNCMKTSAATAQVNSDIKELTTFQTDVVAKGLSQGLGTPTFVIGTVKDGVLTGRLIEGAYPVLAFQNVIEEQLKK